MLIFAYIIGVKCEGQHIFKLSRSQITVLCRFRAGAQESLYFFRNLYSYEVSAALLVGERGSSC